MPIELFKGVALFQKCGKYRMGNRQNEQEHLDLGEETLENMSAQSLSGDSGECTIGSGSPGVNAGGLSVSISFLRDRKYIIPKSSRRRKSSNHMIVRETLPRMLFAAKRSNLGLF